MGRKESAGNNLRSDQTGSTIGNKAIKTAGNGNRQAANLTISGNTLTNWNNSALDLISVVNADIGGNAFINFSSGAGLGQNWNRCAVAVRGTGSKPSSYVSIHHNLMDSNHKGWSFSIYLGTDTYLSNINIKHNYIANCDDANVKALGLEAVQPSGMIVDSHDMRPLIHYDQGSVAGATTFDRTNGASIAATLTGNIIVTLTAGKNKGDTLTLILTQDATGSRTVIWPSNFKKAGGRLSLSTAANAVDTIFVRWDGTT